MNVVKNLRIRDCFAKLKQANKKALIGYIAAGHPNIDSTVELLRSMAKSGTDIIEVGVPFSDPSADGPIIQHATQQALDNGMTLARVLEQIAIFRKENKKIPIVLMGYLNPIEQMGWDSFAKQAEKVGVDGVLVVDLPPDEAVEAVSILKKFSIAPIFLVAPTTNLHRLSQISPLADGFIYFVSRNGITGQGKPDFSYIDSFLPTLRQSLDLPVVIGFGVRDPEMAKCASQRADGVVIGSAIVDLLEKSPENETIFQLERFLVSIRKAIDS